MSYFSKNQWNGVNERLKKKTTYIYVVKSEIDEIGDGI